jgi:hypothetical protein
MNKKIVFPALCFFLVFGIAMFSLNLKRASATPSEDGKTLVLYDADLGTIPSTPLMNFAGFPTAAAAPIYENRLTLLDTTTSGNSTYAGWISNAAATEGFPILDRIAGFEVDFTVQVENESHTNNNRAGFSIIILSKDARGIELAFWENEIWAQNDDTTGGLFKHGEGTIFTTSAGLINYQVIVVNDTFTLIANNKPILTGPVRDYSKFSGFPDPYETPNFLFLGDNTTSAQARTRLSFVSITGTERTTSTSSPLSPGSPTPHLSMIPSPSPTPTMRDFEFCPFHYYRP